MRDRNRLGPLPGSRRIGLVLPVVLSIVNSIAIWAIVAEGRRCDEECASTLLALPAPLVGPLSVVGVGDAARYPSPGATALAGLVVVVAVFVWWWMATSRLAERARGSMLRFFGLYALVFVVLCVKNSVVLAVADGPLLWPAIVIECLLAAVFLWRLVPPRPVKAPVIRRHSMPRS